MSRWIAIKIMTERTKSWLGVFNFIMITYLFIAESPYPFWLVLPIAGVGTLLIGYVDYKFIFPKEIEKVANKNPFLVGLQKDITEIKEKVCYQ